MSLDAENETEIPARDDEDSLEDLQSRTRLTGAELDPEDFEDFDESLVIDLDPVLTELEVKVIPQQSDEFTCTSCYLVLHRSQNVSKAGTPAVCRDCAE